MASEIAGQAVPGALFSIVVIAPSMGFWLAEYRRSTMATPRVMMLCQAFPATSETFILRQVHGLKDALVGIVATRVDRSLLPDAQYTGPLAEIDTASPPAGWYHAPVEKARWCLQRRCSGGECSWSPRVQGRLRSAIAASNADVLLVQYGHIAVWAYPAIEASKRPFVVHFHGLDASSALGSAEYCKSLAHILPRAKAVIAVSRPMRERLRKIAPAARVELIPCGVEIPESVARISAGQTVCRLLAVGRMVPKKSPLELLASFERASHCCKTPLCLDYAGDGPLLANARAYVAAHGLSCCVTLHGEMRHERVMSLMRTADIFVQHSVAASDGDREGSPVAVMEAAAMGIPVVATRHEGIPESVLDGTTGLLVDEHDVEGMARAIGKLADDPCRRLVMGQSAFKHAKRALDVRIALPRLRCVLESDVV